MNISSSSYMAVLCCFIVVSTVIACKPNNISFGDGNTSKEWQDISDTGLSGINDGNLVLLDSKEPLNEIEPLELPKFNDTISNNALIDENDTISNDDSGNRFNNTVAVNKAWKAATKKGKCPKLVRSKIDSTKIVRNNEVMVNLHCDYYIYPPKGKRLSIESLPDNIEANLISPDYHNFNNGSYLVQNSDKYVIRLTYDGIEYKNNPIDYDVTIEVE